MTVTIRTITKIQAPYLKWSGEIKHESVVRPTYTKEQKDQALKTLQEIVATLVMLGLEDSDTKPVDQTLAWLKTIINS